MCKCFCECVYGCFVRVHACALIIAHYQCFSHPGTGRSVFLYVFAHTYVHVALLLRPPRRPQASQFL